MKKNLLLGSAVASSAATLMGIAGILADAGRAIGAAGALGLLGVALFFVGWVFPKE